jgi:UDP-N-acetylmuramoyl-L-alanyl-D-glutamate--2,6-diaminopimelate ligase
MVMTLAKLIADDAPVPHGAGSLPVVGLTADSRAVKPGYVFAALPGISVDGAAFLAQAFEKGAAAAIAGRGARGPGPIIEAPNPRQVFAHAAARFFGRQPELTVAITGTNGKTSVAAFVRQIWSAMGFRAASLGTVGVVGPEGTQYLSHTTPDPVELHGILAKLTHDHVKHLALEASSHGLAQFRLDGVRIAAAAFTNLTRDHLDYHASLEDYFNAKMRLFSELLPEGAPAVINADSPYAPQVAERCAKRGLRIFTVGAQGHDLRLLSVQRNGLGQRLEIESAAGRHAIDLPLVGEFQASNALAAAGLVIATGGEETIAMRALASLEGAKGRLELVGRTDKGAAIFIDYAHTPDALETAMKALRPYAEGRLIAVFGAGGDRDKGKRPLMGKAGRSFADVTIVTDDNPRTENAADIRAQVLAGVPGATEIGDRAEAIREAVKMLRKGDVLLVAGKGHEPGQTIGKTVHPFSDHDAVAAALRGEPYHG